MRQMKVAVLGTGIVGRTLAAGCAAAGHTVTIGTRDPGATLARTTPDAMGTPPFAEWQAGHADLPLVAFSAAAADADLVVNATQGAVSLNALELTGAANLAGRVLLDVANPLDFTDGLRIDPVETDSLAERIQRAFPEARVVKSLNTMNAAVMTAPSRLGDGDHTVFVAGDDADAKATVSGLLRDFGWRDISDLGELAAARGTEMYFRLWFTLMRRMGTPLFNIKVVR
ncbi:NADPH-dependent F420 reductase [Streptomyces gamaensis]|uniref:NADPH-dependent F420 reductase n=1 Tax=Streptomyces gamaensis TaxID=1763542 RepID=A0ABW0YY66_9ACTN